MINLRHDLKFMVAVFVLVGFTVALYTQQFHRDRNVVEIRKEFPSQVHDWFSNELPFSPGVEAVLSPDFYVYKTFSKEAASPVTLLLLRYNNIEKADLSHSPTVCLTGQGWEIKKVSEQTIETGIAAIPQVHANRILLQKLDTRMVVLYWYQSVDRSLANRGYQKLILFLDYFSGKPVTNAFVRLSSPVEAGRTIDEVSVELCNFVVQAFPKIIDFMQ